jgi:hypothetical protein
MPQDPTIVALDLETDARFVSLRKLHPRQA